MYQSAGRFSFLEIYDDQLFPGRLLCSRCSSSCINPYNIELGRIVMCEADFRHGRIAPDVWQDESFYARTLHAILHKSIHWKASSTWAIHVSVLPGVCTWSIGYKQEATDVLQEEIKTKFFTVPYSWLNWEYLQVLSVLNCWLKCMLLDPITQADHPECKSRPDTGLSAITELDPGYITGRFLKPQRMNAGSCPG
jgi:hypothetical protein